MLKASLSKILIGVSLIGLFPLGAFCSPCPTTLHQDFDSLTATSNRIEQLSKHLYHHPSKKFDLNLFQRKLEVDAHFKKTMELILELDQTTKMMTLKTSQYLNKTSLIKRYRTESIQTSALSDYYAVNSKLMKLVETHSNCFDKITIDLLIKTKQKNVETVLTLLKSESHKKELDGNLQSALALTFMAAIASALFIVGYATIGAMLGIFIGIPVTIAGLIASVVISANLLINNNSLYRSKESQEPQVRSQIESLNQLKKKLDNYHSESFELPPLM